jgi:hypothetical protein
MLYARFLTNFISIFIKWTKINVQNEKPRMNLERPFFWDPNLGKYAVYFHASIYIFIMILSWGF